jgi:tyrosinase
MSVQHISRRTFVKGSLSALALSSLPFNFAFGQTISIRPEWNEFRNGPHYASFFDAIRTMRANGNARANSSWRYWIDGHVANGPHNASYFLAWHRGFIYHVEQQMRSISGNPNLVLPYWDYYQNPNLPPEFTDPASGNPLYVPGRVNTNVHAGLSLAPFAPDVWNFERGRPNAFEPILEDRPHDSVHNIIGGVMTTMESPLDPVFYLHHANIDRLWHAWALPDGKGMPGVRARYWGGNFRYANRLSGKRDLCYHPNRLEYDYSNNSVPQSIPPQARAGRIIRVQAQSGQGTVQRPPVGAFQATAPRALNEGRRSLGGAKDISLRENPVSVHIPLVAADRQNLRSIAARAKARGALPDGEPYKSMHVVLDDVRLVGEGARGGFFYQVYLNLPPSGAPSTGEPHLLGSIGPFQINAASHHGHASVTFPAADVLANVPASDLDELTVSLVRVSGPNSPGGPTISIGELRVEISSDQPYETEPHVPGAGYR